MFASLSILFAALTATSTAQVAERLRLASPNAQFDVTGCVTFVSYESNGLLGLEDASGPAIFFLKPPDPERRLVRGLKVRLQGNVTRDGRSQTPTAFCTRWDVLGKATPPEPVKVSELPLQNGALDGRVVALSGTAVDAFRDEIDPDWNYIILDCGGETITVTGPTSVISPDRLHEFIDAEVRVEGLCLSHALGARRQLGVTVYLPDRQGLRILRPAPADPFAVPDVPDSALSPAQIRKLGKRRVCGRILAVWSGARALLRSATGQLVGISFRDNAPPCGAAVEAVGSAETDLYRINLARAEWRAVPDKFPASSPEAAEPVTAAAILRDARGEPTVETHYHGRAIRLDGTIVALPGPDDRPRQLQMANGDLTVPVDFTSAPAVLSDLEIGCRVRAKGVCILNTDNWQPNAGFPHTNGFTLVLRTANDLVVLARPPWWTAQRLLILIGVLLAALVGIVTWNRILNRLVERRGRELARERSAHERAELKLEERMRLAVELHDTIAQDLTGIILQAEASRYAEKPDAAQALDRTAKALSGCRERLRDCIWDLRNRALEEHTFEDAVRRTLAPHLGTSELTLDNTVARRRFSDNALHQILSVLRELAVNAIRHGKATRLAVVSRMIGDRLSITFTDNGTGFDASSRPGPSLGHFGLQGAAERIHQLEGKLDIESSPGSGTTVRLTDINTDL